MSSCKKQRDLRIAKRKQIQTSRKIGHDNSTHDITVQEITVPEPEELITQKKEEEHNSMEIEYYGNKQPYTGPIRRGEIYFFDKGPIVGVEQIGGRPGIIVSNNQCNKNSEFVEVVYTTCQEKTSLPTHVLITSTPKQCMALCEQVHTLSKKKIRNFYGELTTEEMSEINKALKINLGLTDATYTKDIEQEEYIKQLENTIKELNLLLKPDKDIIKDTNSTEEVVSVGIKIQLDFLMKMYNQLLDKIINREDL